MIERQVAGFGEFVDLLKELSASSHIFRGVERASFQLTPTVGRSLERRLKNGSKPFECLDLERNAFADFKREARAHISTTLSELEWLALAQHHGMPTRLLDWTWNPLCALYFSMAPGKDDDGQAAAVYALDSQHVGWEFGDEPNWKASHNLIGKSAALLAGLSNVRAYTPPRFSPRMFAQASVFTMHALPWAPLDDESITRVLIPNAAKREIRELLFNLHVMPKTLFPDLDGLGLSLKFWRFDRDQW